MNEYSQILAGILMLSLGILMYYQFRQTTINIDNIWRGAQTVGYLTLIVLLCISLLIWNIQA